MTSHYDREGKPLDLMAWASLFEDSEYKIVKQDRVEGKGFLSTVWLGLDHSFGDGPPLIFETMLFSKDGDEDYCERYSTLQGAEAGHAKKLSELSND